ncbi:MAG: polar amino acid transport system substrate-binding protein [Candidatus Poriferisodalaceae bacterium]|jgi:polar amino acid transport system substrate-binding protein
MTKRLLAALMALALLLAACGSDDDPAADEETTSGDETAADCSAENLSTFAVGKLTIATGEPVFPPWMLDDDPSSGEGFESAMAYAIAAEMGFDAADVDWVRTDFDEAIAPGDKDYDFNMQQYSITEAREEIVDFSLPYYESQKSVIALNSSPAATATSFAELAGATWGATIGTTDLDYMEGQLGLENVAVYDTQADVVAAMLAGQIDATVIALPSAFYLTAVEIDDSVIASVLPTEDGGEGMGLLFADGNPLRPCVNEAISSLDAAGTLDAIAVKWLQGDGEIPLVSE